MQEQPEHSSERDKRVEFSVPTWLVLNGLEAMGYKVVLETKGKGRFAEISQSWNKAPSRASTWLKAPTISTFTLKTLLRH